MHNCYFEVLTTYFNLNYSFLGNIIVRGCFWWRHIVVTVYVCCFLFFGFFFAFLVSLFVCFLKAQSPCALCPSHSRQATTVTRISFHIGCQSFQEVAHSGYLLLLFYCFFIVNLEQDCIMLGQPVLFGNRISILSPSTDHLALHLAQALVSASVVWNVPVHGGYKYNPCVEKGKKGTLYL